MPNMDDIAFFDTESLEHRGGIWSEACRKPQTRSSTESGQVGAQVHPIASIPVVTTISPDPISSVSTQKTDDDASIQSAPPTTTMKSEIWPSSASPDDTPDSWHNMTRRRTWFSSIRNDVTAASTPSFPDDHHRYTPEVIRGRSSESDKSSVAKSHPSIDYPDLPPTPLDTTQKTIEQETLQMSSSSSRRSVSQHSIKTQSDVDQESNNLQNKSTPPTPRRVSNASEKVVGPSSPPSFLTTLKSKTADKQAIKETAKEAIRKWGVNWGGFKKDGLNTTDSDPASDASRSGVLHAEGNKTHRPRASYAEVRAAVAERKEREKVSQPLQSVLEPTTQHLPSQPETVNIPLSPNTLTANPETSLSVSHISMPHMLARKKSSPSINRIDTEIDAQQDLQPHLTEEPIKQTPIHVQPVAKTMSIPGIHASHRGDVQSMGYVAPQPQPQVPAKETMLKNPAIQTVYRFLKSSNGDRSKHETSETQSQNDQPPVQTITEEASDNHFENTSLMPIVQSCSHDTSKPPPPPLPPRPQSNVTFYPGRNQGLISPSPPLSASVALRNIVEKADRSRIQLTDCDISTSASSGDYFPQESRPGDDDDRQAASGTRSTGNHDSHSVSLQTDLDSSDELKPSKNTSLLDIGKLPPLPPRRSKTPTDAIVES